MPAQYEYPGQTNQETCIWFVDKIEWKSIFSLREIEKEFKRVDSNACVRIRKLIQKRLQI